MAADAPSRHSHFTDVLYMLVPAVLLSFLPGLNGLMGGVAGGFRAGNVRDALSAGLAAAVAAPLSVGGLALLARGASASYFYWGLGFWGFALATALGLLVGSLMGAWSAAHRRLAHLPARSRRRSHRRS